MTFDMYLLGSNKYLKDLSPLCNASLAAVYPLAEANGPRWIFVSDGAHRILAAYFIYTNCILVIK